MTDRPTVPDAAPLKDAGEPSDELRVIIRNTLSANTDGTEFDQYGVSGAIEKWVNDISRRITLRVSARIDADAKEKEELGFTVELRDKGIEEQDATIRGLREEIANLLCNASEVVTEQQTLIEEAQELIEELHNDMGDCPCVDLGPQDCVWAAWLTRAREIKEGKDAKDTT